jgi:hypothetical protein
MEILLYIMGQYISIIEIFEIFESQCLDPTQIFFFTIDYIKNTVLFMMQTPTTETIITIHAFISILYIIAVIRPIEIRTADIVFGIYASIRIFAILDSQTIGTIFTVDREVTNMITILIISHIETHVAVLVIDTMVGIIRVLT